MSINVTPIHSIKLQRKRHAISITVDIDSTINVTPIRSIKLQRKRYAISITVDVTIFFFGYFLLYPASLTAR